MSQLGIQAGTDWHQPFAFVDAAGAVVNLTGATGLTFVVYSPPSTVLLTLTVGSGIVVDSATAGEITVSLTNAQTQSKDGEYRFEIYATLASGDREILDSGVVLFRESYIGV